METMIKQTLDLSGVTPFNRTQIEHLVHIAGEFTSRIIFEHRNRTINGKSMLGILSLGMTEHEPVTLIVDGEEYFFEHVEDISVDLASDEIQLVRLADYDFWSKVMSKFL